MTSQQRHLWQELCLIAVMEPDPKKQAAIVVELNRMLQLQRKKAHSSRVSRGPRQTSG
jgi:glucose-6-phosphate 1-dehydrogenase